MFDPNRQRTFVLMGIAALVVAACSSDAGSSFPDPIGSVDGDADASAGGTGAGATNDGGAGGGGTGSGFGSNDSGAASPETCDGIDNDGDGIIDNVDVAGDGVCDCLKIATLGFAGTAGVGDVFSTWLDGKSAAGAVALEGQTLTAALLANYQVIVVQNVKDDEPGKAGKGSGLGRAYTQAEVDALAAWVEAGGGLMTLIGYGSKTEITNVNRLLAPFSMSYAETPILAKSGSKTVPITHWTAGHPLAANIVQVGVDNGRPVIGGDLLAWEPEAGKYDVGRAKAVGKGHVFVWGDEWITFDSEWSNLAEYQVERLWLNTLKWLAPADLCQVALPPVH